MIEVLAKLANQQGWGGENVQMPQPPAMPPAAQTPSVPPAPAPQTPPAQPLTPKQQQQQREQDVANAEKQRQQQNAPGFWDRSDQWISERVKDLAPSPVYEHFQKNKPLYYTLGGMTLLGGLGGVLGGRKVRRFMWPMALLGGLGLAATIYNGYKAWDAQPWYKKAWQYITK